MSIPAYKHWFWDFDGTLFDTYPRVVRAFQKGLKARGIGVSDHEVLALVKVGLGHASRHFRNGELADELLRSYILHAEDEGPEGLVPYEHAGEMLREVLRRGGSNYLYTHRDRTSIEGLKLHGLWELFTDAVTAEDDFPHKPAPDALRHLLRKHGRHPGDCVIVGDRPIDLDAGLAVGMEGILFDPGGFHAAYPAPRRYAAYADMLADLAPPAQK